MYRLASEKGQAVLFFGKEDIAKELLYPELEALLEGYVPLVEWANSTRKAVYVEFDSQFCVSAAVFFVMAFDPKGAVDPSWKLPLYDLARTAARGPDLGCGPIRLACASQCPNPHYQEWLWDPHMQAQSGHFKQIKKALKRNRLGFYFGRVEDLGVASGADARQLEQQITLRLSKQYEQALREQVAQLLEEQRQRLASDDKDQALTQLHLDYATKLEAQRQEWELLQLQLEELRRENLDLAARNQELKGVIDGQVQKIEGLREYFEHKLRRAQEADQANIDSLKTQHAAEMDARLSAATTEMQELLNIKVVELQYRTEHEQQLRAEIARLRREQQDLMANSGDLLLEKLSRKGVNFVTYQPGAGHITIPLGEIAQFVENPYAFTASYCGVSEKHYRAWLDHYQMPVCVAKTDQGETCCADLTRIGNPTDFVLGESDLCETHRRRAKKSHLKAI